MSSNRPATLVINAFEMAVERRGYPHGVIHHSDQGSQYTSESFTKRCRALVVLLSMGSVINCYDKAMAEGFFATQGCELHNIVQLFKGITEAQSAIFECIEEFYNTRRRHSQLSHLSPVQFESAMAA